MTQSRRYQLVHANSNPEVPHDTEDKRWWMREGEVLEQQFVKLCQESLGIEAEINPDKRADPTVADLIVQGRLADLKAQQTPFFTARRYGLDPQYCVTFNRKDYVRYLSLYPELDVFFWVNWRQTSWRDIEVQPMVGVYLVAFDSLCRRISYGVPEHSYVRRTDDHKGNARSSFLFDVRSFQCLHGGADI